MLPIEVVWQTVVCEEKLVADRSGIGVGIDAVVCYLESAFVCYSTYNFAQLHFRDFLADEVDGLVGAVHKFDGWSVVVFAHHAHDVFLFVPIETRQIGDYNLVVFALFQLVDGEQMVVFIVRLYINTKKAPELNPRLLRERLPSDVCYDCGVGL